MKIIVEIPIGSPTALKIVFAKFLKIPFPLPIKASNYTEAFTLTLIIKASMEAPVSPARSLEASLVPNLSSSFHLHVFLVGKISRISLKMVNCSPTALKIKVIKSDGTAVIGKWNELTYIWAQILINAIKEIIYFIHGITQYVSELKPYSRKGLFVFWVGSVWQKSFS